MKYYNIICIHAIEINMVRTSVVVVCRSVFCAVAHVWPFAMVVRIRASSTLVSISGVYSTNTSTTFTTRGTSSLGSRKFTPTYVDVGYEQPQSVRSGRKLSRGKLVDRCRRVGDPEFGNWVHGYFQRPFGHYFLVSVERLDKLGYRKPTVDTDQKRGKSLVIMCCNIL